jgi:hypothetical protein
MKVTIPTAMIGSTLQASAILYSSVPGAEEHNSAITFVMAEPADTVSLASNTPLFEHAYQAEVTPPTTFAMPLRWRSAAARRFRLLTEKEAFETATPQELAELESLSMVRRRDEAPRSGEEILHEYEQGQLVRDLLRSLTRYVQFEERSGFVESSPTRRRA